MGNKDEQMLRDQQQLLKNAKKHLDDIHEYEERITKLKAEKKSLEKSYKYLQNKCESQRAEIEEMKDNIDGLERYSDGVMMKRVDAEKEVDELKEKIDDIKKREQYYKDGWEAQTRQCGDNTKLRRKLEESYQKEIKKLIVDYEDEIGRLKVNESVLEKITNRQEKEIENLKDEAKSAENIHVKDSIWFSEQLATLKDNVENLKKQFEYGIKCKICGDELTLGDSMNMMWGCSYLENSPNDDNKTRKKTGRNVADEHFSKSRVCMSFEARKINEAIIKILNGVIKLIEEMK